MKRSTKVAILATALLVSVALLSVGFAAWVISTPQKQEATGNVHAQSASNESVIFSAVVDNEEGIEFGKPSDAAIETWKQGNGNGKSIWITNPNGNVESLSVNITLTFTSGTLHTLTVADSYANAGTEEGWNYDEAVSNGYISGPTYKLVDADGTGITLSENGTFTIPDGGVEFKANEAAKTIKITVTYAWGSVFGGRNPYFYYNEQGQTTDNSKAAEDALNNLYELLGSEYGTTFTFTFTAA